jgi:hypothetical protein
VVCPAFEAARLKAHVAVRGRHLGDRIRGKAAPISAFGHTGCRALDLRRRRAAHGPIRLEARLGGGLLGAPSQDTRRIDDARRSGGAAPLPQGLRRWPGATEAEISRRSEAERRSSARRPPHGASGPTALAKNQAVLIDAWDKPDGWFYDITRSTFFGQPTDEYRKVWSIVLAAQGAAIDKAAPGVPCSEVDAAARRVIEKAGYGEYFNHRLGHGLGIDVHEPPYMVGTDRTVLEPGMTFTSEPGIYLPGRFGVRIEDDIVHGARAESLSPRVERLDPLPA